MASPLNLTNSSVKFPYYSKLSFVPGQVSNDFVEVRPKRPGINHNKASKH